VMASPSAASRTRSVARRRAGPGRSPSSRTDMKILVTGASGYIGSRLVQRLVSRGGIGIRPMSHLAVADQRLAWVPDGALALEGDLGEPSMLARIGSFAPDVVLHLAAVPG